VVGRAYFTPPGRRFDPLSLLLFVWIGFSLDSYLTLSPCVPFFERHPELLSLPVPLLPALQNPWPPLLLHRFVTNCSFFYLTLLDLDESALRENLFGSFIFVS
jgi:hypothetical protein